MENSSNSLLWLTYCDISRGISLVLFSVKTYILKFNHDSPKSKEHKCAHKCLYNENNLKLGLLFHLSSQYKLRFLRPLQHLAEDQINIQGFKLYLEFAPVDNLHINSYLFC